MGVNISKSNNDKVVKVVEVKEFESQEKEEGQEKSGDDLDLTGKPSSKKGEPVTGNLEKDLKSVDQGKVFLTPNVTSKVGVSKSGETNLVQTSTFPYKKPKAVPVKLFLKKEDTRTAGPSANELFINEHIRKPTYQAPMKFLQDVQVRKFSEPCILPTDTVLQHRTVAALRRSSINFPTYHTYQPEFYRQENYMDSHLLWRDWSRCGKIRRPPTPQPVHDPLYPVRRTEDYLVANCLLAAEKDRDRVKANRARNRYN